MNRTCLLFAFVLIHSVLLAQKKQDVYYLKNNGKTVATKDSADFIRVIQEPDSGAVWYKLLEFYPDGKRKTLGQLSAFEPALMYEDVRISFNEKGVKIKTETFKNGSLLGTAYTFFPDGKVQEQVDYLPFTSPLIKAGMMPKEGLSFNPNKRLIYLADSTGRVLIKEGNGHLISRSKQPGGDELMEEGDYKDGYKHGVWTGKYTSGRSSYTENYEANKLISGESIVDGTRYRYKQEMESAQFKGGPKAWSEYLSFAMKYPREALEQRIEGVVLVEFTVEKDGSLTDIVVRRSVDPSLDREALRILEKSPKWIPLKFKGIPARVKHQQAFNFRIPRN